MDAWSRHAATFAHYGRALKDQGGTGWRRQLNLWLDNTAGLTRDARIRLYDIAVEARNSHIHTAAYRPRRRVV